MRALISNPPYNMKWKIPPFAQLQSRFCDCALPPESNANYAFVLTGLDNATRAVFLLPCGALTTDNRQEREIRKYLLEKNLIEAVIACPDNMFESTMIATSILVLDHQKQATDIMFVDMRRTHETEQRKQNGQYGGDSHTKRTYTKEINVFSDDQIEMVLRLIKERENVKGLSQTVSCQTVVQNDYLLSPSRYIDLQEEENTHRPYQDILDDINRTVASKNILKLTINETIAKSLGLYEFGNLQKKSRMNGEQMSANMEKLFGRKILKDDYISLTKNKGEIKFENTSKEEMSEIFALILQMYKSHIMYLNNEENRYLIELRDALLPDLMSGKIEV